jgi:hypothetical protein
LIARVRTHLSWRLLGMLLFVVGIVLSPLRAVATTVPTSFAHDAAVGSTAMVRIETGPSRRPERERGHEYVYDDAHDRYSDPSNPPVVAGAPGVHAYDDALELLERCEPSAGVIYVVASATAAAEGAIISEGKFGYLFGEASGNAHNVERALENASQLSRVGVFNNAEGQALLQAHFDAVVSDSSNIIGSTANQYGNFVTRESLFAGPGGFIKFQSTWQVLEGGAQRFITAIPFGGP